MRTSGNVVLVTGGSTGIGLAIAKRMASLGNTVIICGRRKDRLDSAKSAAASLHAIQCDISKESDRDMLLKKIESEFKGLNILINNAGIQLKTDLTKGNKIEIDSEIDTNLKAQMHLSVMFVPLLKKSKNSAIVNVTSGLAFVPRAEYPIYCATKAALHSFTMSLRHQLGSSGIKVFELIPPLVYDTELHYGKPLEKTDFSISTEELTDEFVRGLESDRLEIPAGPTKKWVALSKSEADEAFRNMNR